MSYREALQAAGAEVLEAKYFGSYQGDWYALVNYNGSKQWVHGSYGSCSGCDAFCAEFDFDGDDNGCEEHRYEKQADCTACKERTVEYQRRLANFGKSYLDNAMTQVEAEKIAAEHLEWDSEAQEMLDFLKANSIPNVPFNLQQNERS